MEYAPLGGTGMEVSRIALGCGNFGGIGSAPEFFGQGETESQAAELLDAARRLGIALLDTADAYGGGRSERWIGSWLARQPPAVREGAVVTTKVFHSVAGDPDDRGLAPERITRALEASLNRLRLEHVDLYLIHEPDPETPLEDTLEALDGLVRAGTVRAIGASNLTAVELEHALALSKERGFARFECVQNSYSLLERSFADVLSICEREGLAFTAFSPLAGGWLTGKYRRDEQPPPGSRMTLRPEPYRELVTPAVFDALDALGVAARERGIDTATLALAWLLADSRVTSVIVGPRNPCQLEPAQRALELRLTRTERDGLSGVFP